MNHKEFRQHFINAIQQFHLVDVENKTVVIAPIYEKEKWTAHTYDEIMRLQVLPAKRRVSFDEAVTLFTFWEGYYPCWIEIDVVNDEVFLKTSLRMRKASVRDDHFLYPFRKMDQDEWKNKSK